MRSDNWEPDIHDKRLVSWSVAAIILSPRGFWVSRAALNQLAGPVQVSADSNVAIKRSQAMKIEEHAAHLDRESPVRRRAISRRRSTLGFSDHKPSGPGQPMKQPIKFEEYRVSRTLILHRLGKLKASTALCSMLSKRCAHMLTHDRINKKDDVTFQPVSTGSTCR